MIHNTMRLTEAPKEIATLTREVWDKLFEAYGFDTFHPLEGRGVLKATLNLRREGAEGALQRLCDRGFATSQNL